MTQIRRVVTGHDASGKAVVLSDGPVPTVHGNPIRPGQLSFEVWKTHSTPVPIGAVEPEPTTGPRSLQPPPHGTLFRISVVPPESEETRKLTPEQARELFVKSGAKDASTFGRGGRHPMMHRTETVDYAVVLEGEITLLLDEGDAYNSNLWDLSILRLNQLGYFETLKENESYELKRNGDIGVIKGLYALCPYIAGKWPQDALPSTTENNGILLDLHNNRGAMAYGIEELNAKNPLAWPGFATEDDVKGFPYTVISVNECDPLRDEGVGFYRLLLRAGVPARCRQVMGTTHGTEVFTIACPEISRDCAADLARFARV